MKPLPPSNPNKGYARINSNQSIVSANNSIEQMRQANEKLQKQIKDLVVKEQNNKSFDSKPSPPTPIEGMVEKEKVIFQLNSKIKALEDTVKKLNTIIDKKEGSPLLRVPAEERSEFWQSIRLFINEKPIIESKINQFEIEKYIYKKRKVERYGTSIYKNK